jgi:U3 small nucleolar ribonucleoprotein protein LCP5
MIEGRIILEKIKLLESKMRYQIEKLVQLAVEESSDDKVINGQPFFLACHRTSCPGVWALIFESVDPLAFRPNPEALMGGVSDEDDHLGADAAAQDGIYRPPKLAPMPYVEPTSKEARARRPPPAPHALASLAHLDPSRPFVESATGLGIVPSMQSARARELRRMEEFEEDNMTRLVLKKKDERRRKKDEEDIALGGAGGITGKRRGGGLEDEFADILREGRRGRALTGDGYDELRMKGRNEGALARSRVRLREDTGDLFEGQRQKKKGRFERDVKAVKRRWARKHTQK